MHILTFLFNVLLQMMRTSIMLNCSVVYTEAAFILVYLLLDKHLYLSVLYLCSKIKGLNLSVCIDLN